VEAVKGWKIFALAHSRRNKSGYYVTLWQMLRHQFVISIRTVGKTTDSATLLAELGSAQRRSFRNCGKATLFAFAAFMIGVNSHPGAPANVSLLGHANALPAVFVNFFVAFCYFQILRTGLNGLLVGEFARTAASISCGQKSTMTSRISYDIDSSWAMSVTPFFGFLNSGKLRLAFSTLEHSAYFSR
jgi:hypothetical protein